MSVAKFGSSPNVPMNLFHRGSVARSIWGDKAVVIPKALYSLDAISPNCFVIAGSNVAANPNSSGHCEMVPPLPALYSASLFAPLRGSELLLAGIPKPKPSTNCCILLSQVADTIGLDWCALYNIKPAICSTDIFAAKSFALIFTFNRQSSYSSTTAFLLRSLKGKPSFKIIFIPEPVA